MTSPLSSIPNAEVNASTPTTAHINKSYTVTSYARIEDHENSENSGNSDLVSDIKLAPHSPANVNMTSPLRPFKAKIVPSPSQLERSPSKKSPRKISPRFPIRASMSPEKLPAQEIIAQKSPVRESTITMQDVMRENQGLKHAIQIFEDGDSDMEDAENGFDQDDNTMVTALEGDDGHVDDTMMSTFSMSTFSMVPDMTVFAKIGRSPSRDSVQATPRADSSGTPSTVKRPHDFDDSTSPTPRRTSPRLDTGNTTNLLDFTEQFNSFSRHNYASSVRRDRASPTKSQTLINLLSTTPSLSRTRGIPDTPTTRMSHLIDFEIPPAPTPRSLPTITPRELESLKSSFMSEISSLKASLSGREAEVQSLKTAVSDAEKRVGETMEQVREERNNREQLEVDKEVWEERAREMESVLRNVKEEIVLGEKERDALEGRLDESEKRREAAELMAQEAESKLAGMKAGSAVNSSPEKRPSTPSSTAKEVEMAVEKVARELHALYKSKHETKVAALKKSYEGRWERKVKELEARVAMLSKENEDLRVARDATLSGVVPKLCACTGDELEEVKAQAAIDAQVAKELEAKVHGLAEELKTVKGDNDDLRQELEMERVEKGELVAAVEEMISLQSVLPPTTPALQESAPPATTASAPPAVENFRSSITRISGLRQPASTSGTGSAPVGESRIGRPGHERNRSLQAPRPAGKSGIVSSIEKMGNYYK